MLRSPTHLMGGHGPTSAATANNNNTHHTSNNINGSPRNNIGINGGIGGLIGATTAVMANGKVTTINTTQTATSTTGATSNNSNTRTQNNSSSSSSTSNTTTTRTSLFDSCHRKIRLIGGGPVAFLGGLVAKARRKERDGDQSSTDTKLYLEESVLERKLPDADLKALVDLPAGLDYNEWLASHTLALFEHVNLVYGTISEFCTTSGCPDMTGPGNRTYLWFDEKGKKTRVAAPQYIDYVMTFTQKTVSDESIFPTKYANEFPSSFESIARKILRLQFHVIAHLYAAHFREIALLGLHTHLNLTYAHLTALHRRFTLIDEKETDVLRDLEIALRLTDDGSTSTLQGSESTMCGGSVGGGGGGGGNSSSTGGGVGGIGGGGGTTSEDTSLIDGDASVQPICTQPEAMKGLSSDQSDIRGGAGGGGGSGIGIDGGYCSNTSGGTLCSSSGLNSSHIGNVMNFNNNNSNHSSTHPITTNSLLQCNSSNSSSSNNSHTTTTA